MTEIRIGFANELFKKTPVIAPDVANKAFNMRSTQQNLKHTIISNQKVKTIFCETDLLSYSN